MHTIADRYTQRQIELAWRESVKARNADRADQIENTGLGMAGRAALSVINMLRRGK